MKNLLIKIGSVFVVLILINFLLERINTHILIHFLCDLIGFIFCVFEINKFYGPSKIV